ncbi:hypothetical protein GCM10010449_24260 [Streptomyces rectiviolaceus]|uniref:Uncharacterized protein n=1 Tax=Streptomyces rectiviolaceus TaxID=332591 RepID=A0ABP6MGG3_9ACTN
MGEAVQEAVGGVGGGPAGVVTHADGEHGVLGGRHGHPRARGHLKDDEAEPGGDGVGEPRERRVLAVPAQQLRVLLVAGGLELGLESEGDESRGVGGVGRGDGGGRGGRRRCLRLAPRGVLCGVVGHGLCSLRRSCW